MPEEMIRYISPYLDEVVAFAAFLSKSYGTGNLGLDTCYVVGALVLALLLVSLMRIMGFGRTAAVIEGELIEEVSQSLHDLQVRALELRCMIAQEFEKCRGELCYIQQEVKRMNYHARNSNYRATAVIKRAEFSDSLSDLF